MGIRARCLRSVCSSMPNIVLGAGITAVHEANKVPAHKRRHSRVALSDGNVQATRAISNALVNDFLKKSKKKQTKLVFSNISY